jgi:hypothetical protein
MIVCNIGGSPLNLIELKYVIELTGLIIIHELVHHIFVWPLHDMCWYVIYVFSSSLAISLLQPQVVVSLLNAPPFVAFFWPVVSPLVTTLC